jgi:hypothetical protein
MASKYSEAGKGSNPKLRQKKQYDDNYDMVFRRKEKYYDSDESNDWDQELADIINRNQNIENK